MGTSHKICFSSETPVVRKVLTISSMLFVLFWLRLRTVQGSAVPTGSTHNDIKQNSAKNRHDLDSKETKRQMLNVLGIDELPEPKQGIIPHQYMIHIYQKMSTRKSDYEEVNTIRGFTDVGHADSSNKRKFHQIYSFNISALPNSEKIISADFRLLRISTGQEWRYGWAHGMQYVAKLYYKKSVKHQWNGQWYTHTRLIHLDSVVFDIRNTDEDWKVFNVAEALRIWQNEKNLEHNFELQVESVKTGYLMPCYAFGLAENGRAHYKRALLVSFTDDGRVRLPSDSETSSENSSKKPKKRVARQTLEKKEKNRVKRESRRWKRRKHSCKRKSLYVDFALLGWANFIIAPRGYNAYFCHGLCKFPIPEHLKPTNHAMVQNTVHYESNRRRVPPACCVPHKLSGLSMLFHDKGGSVVYKKYENMVVESCGCK